MSPTTHPTLVGIFVGGRASRMDGRAKGLLLAPHGDETLVARLARLARDATQVEPVLVGAHAAYSDAGLEMIADDPAGIGPLGGLLALLSFAARGGYDRVVTLACDLPYVDANMVGRLIALPEHAHALAPRPEYWEPLCACYRVAPVLEAAGHVHARGERALFRVLEELGERAHVLELDPKELLLLRDWDSEADLTSD